MTETDLICWLESPTARESFWMLIVKDAAGNQRPAYLSPGTDIDSLGLGTIVELFDLEKYRKFKREGGSFDGGRGTGRGEPSPPET